MRLPDVALPDDRAQTILENCRRALAPGARVLIVERVRPDRARSCETHRQIARSDLAMLLGLGSQERSETVSTNLSMAPSQPSKNRKRYSETVKSLHANSNPRGLHSICAVHHEPVPDRGQKIVARQEYGRSCLAARAQRPYLTEPMTTSAAAYTSARSSVQKEQAMTRAVQRTIAAGGLAVIGFIVMTVGLPADEEDPYLPYHCHDDVSPAYCHWGNQGANCDTNTSQGHDFCDQHGGIAYEACDLHGGSVNCIS